MTVGELKKILDMFDNELEIRVHVQIKGEHSGHCLFIEEVGHDENADGTEVTEVHLSCADIEKR